MWLWMGLPFPAAAGQFRLRVRKLLQLPTFPCKLLADVTLSALRELENDSEHVLGKLLAIPVHPIHDC
jgi:hypothetical protein